MLLLVSCTSLTDSRDMDVANKICEQNGGISSVEKYYGPFITHRLNIWCINGAHFEADRSGNVYRDFTKKPLTDQKK